MKKLIILLPGKVALATPPEEVYSYFRQKMQAAEQETSKASQSPEIEEQTKQAPQTQQSTQKVGVQAIMDQELSAHLASMGLRFNEPEEIAGNDKTEKPE